MPGYRFQYASAHGPCFVGNGEAVGLLAACIDIPDFQSFTYTDAGLKHSPDHAAHPGIYFFSTGNSNRLAFFYDIPNGCQRLHLPICCGADQAFCRITSHIPRNSGVWKRTARIKNIPQCVPSFCFHNTIAVDSRSKSRAHSNHKGSVCYFGPGISFRQYCIHNDIRLKSRGYFSVCVHNHCNVPVRQNLFCFLFRIYKNAFHILYDGCPLIDSSGKRRHSAHRQRDCDLCHDNLVPAVIEARSDSCCQISRAFD